MAVAARQCAPRLATRILPSIWRVQSPHFSLKPIASRPPNHAFTEACPPGRVCLELAMMRSLCDVREDIDLAKRRLMKTHEIQVFECPRFLFSVQKVARFFARSVSRRGWLV
jgi:hypothetical protein